MGYLIKGDTALVQKRIEYSFQNPNSVKLLVSKNKWEDYNADEVSEFGFKNSTIYVSKNILIGGEFRNRFLIQLEEGLVKLYLLKQKGKDRLFFEKDTLVEINNNNINIILSQFIENSSKLQSQISLVKPNENSLSFFIRNLNSNKFVNIPFYKFGIRTDFSVLQVTPVKNTGNNEFANIKFKSSTFKFGGYVDTPVWNVNGLSLVQNLNYIKGEIAESWANENIYDIKGRYSFIEFNLAPKYNLNFDKIRPFIIAGGTFKYLLNSKLETYQTTRIDNFINITLLEGNPLEFDSFYYGVQFGLGIDIFYNIRRYISLSMINCNSFGNTSGKINSVSISIAGNI